MDAIKEMEIGHVIDFVAEYNEIHQLNDSETEKEKEHEVTKREATQEDWDLLFGG